MDNKIIYKENRELIKCKFEFENGDTYNYIDFLDGKIKDEIRVKTILWDICSNDVSRFTLKDATKLSHFVFNNFETNDKVVIDKAIFILLEKYKLIPENKKLIVLYPNFNNEYKNNTINPVEFHKSYYSILYSYRKQKDISFFLTTKYQEGNVDYFDQINNSCHSVNFNDKIKNNLEFQKFVLVETKENINIYYSKVIPVELNRFITLEEEIIYNDFPTLPATASDFHNSIPTFHKYSAISEFWLINLILSLFEKYLKKNTSKKRRT